MRLHRACLLFCFPVLFPSGLRPSDAAEKEAFRPVRTISLSGVAGRIDHLAIDLEGRRLFVAALGNDSVEVIDLSAGQRSESIKAVKEPQGVRFLADQNLLLVGSGEGGSCEVFDGRSLNLLASVKLGRDADNVRYDPTSHRAYVGYGEGAIGVIDAMTRAKIADIPLKGHPESFQLETEGNRIFVNVPRAMQVAVIDRSRNTVTATWPVHEAHDNYPMALDESHHRLFLGCRKPARLLTLDTNNGKVISSLECSGDTDDVFYDSDTQRVYMSCGEGFLDVFGATAGGQVTRIQHRATAGGARTCLFVPEMKSLYLAVPQRGSQPAEIRVYQALP